VSGKAVTDDLVKFITGTTFESLPGGVVQEVKRSLLDSFGCALAGIATEKGKIALSLAKRLGGTAESTIIGVGGKVSCTNAAYVNGELINGLDFDAIPHIQPFVVPPVLAVGESAAASGKDLIVATAIAQEIARRLSGIFLAHMGASLVKHGKTPDVFGNSNEHILGAAAGVGRLLHLTPEKTAQALGIAGYFCSLPVCRDWESTMPKSMSKYAPAGWLCQGAVTAGLLAEQGFTANPAVLDGDYGFPRFYGGAERWNPDAIVDKLGQEWKFYGINYKPYPCCKFIHTELDCFIDIIETNDLFPDQIESIKAYSLPFVAHPDQHSVTTQVDAQFSVPYNLAVAAYRVKCGPSWQDMEVINDPRIRAFMKKVSVGVDPEMVAVRAKDSQAFPARVEVAADGKTYVKEAKYSKGTALPGYRLTDEQLVEKFKLNAARMLTQTKIDKAVETVMALEKLECVPALAASLAL
jgi:2-methylcitrate dehydratase PrpD